MSTKEKHLNLETGNGNNTYLLRIGVVFLAIVSFFTTANGMHEYIFVHNSVIAYAASAAIQGILLALSMNLPGYLRNIWEKSEKESKFWAWVKKFFLCVCSIFLTIVTIFCSSWFSYIYIADIIHQDSWDTDSELLVQQTYRTELYNAWDYAHAYRTYLEECVGEKILMIEEQTMQLSDSAVDLTINWEEERSVYVQNQETSAASYMATVINAMEKALPQSGATEGAAQEDRDLAATAITDAKMNIADRMEDIQQNINNLDDNIANYNNQLASLRNQLARSTEDTNTAALNNSINTYSTLIDNASQQQASLQMEYMQLDSALQRIPFYESQLGLSSSTSAISIRVELLQLQSEFFQREPDEEKLLQIATNIFENLRNAVRSAADGETSEGNISYTNLLVQMNQLIRNLTDYSDTKDIESGLEKLMTELRDADIIVGSGTEEEAAQEKEADQWQSIWNNRLATLKAQISAMPVYSESEETANGTNRILSELQTGILLNYSRDNSSKELDEMIRRYISDHNAIYQGIIYLQSPYRSLAVFALILALSFDLSGFIFGFVAQGASSQKEKEVTSVVDGNGQINDLNVDDKDQFAWEKAAAYNTKHNSESTLLTGENVQATWSVLKTLIQYIVLTGDYESIDGNYYYKTFRDGVLYHWAVKDTVSYAQGIYIKEEIDGEWSKGKALPENGQELLFSRQAGGPQDGIFMDCQLVFDEGSLILIGKEQQSFLTSIDEYVPVHNYNPRLGESRTVPAKQLAKKALNDQLVVVALNTKGTRVAAIYIVEHQ